MSSWKAPFRALVEHLAEESRLQHRAGVYAASDFSHNLVSRNARWSHFREPWRIVNASPFLCDSSLNPLVCL